MLKTLKSFRKKIKEQPLTLRIVINVIGLVLLVVPLFNLVLFGNVILSETVNRSYPRAKPALASAAAVNVVYYLPSAKLFGFNSPVTIFFKGMRDGYFQTGINLIPEESTERARWWLDIYAHEYFVLYDQEIDKLAQREIKTIDFDFHVNWLNQIYDHIQLLARPTPVKDYKKRKTRFLKLNSYVHTYLQQMDTLYTMVKSEKGEDRTFYGAYARE